MFSAPAMSWSLGLGELRVGVLPFARCDGDPGEEYGKRRPVGRNPAMLGASKTRAVARSETTPQKSIYFVDLFTTLATYHSQRGG
jgi:hypothetical protein